jgi:hypothetical protein
MIPEAIFLVLPSVFLPLDDGAQIPFTRRFITAVFIYVTFVSSPFPPQRVATSDSLAVPFSRPPYLQFIRILLLPILRIVNKNVLVSFQRSFIFPSCHSSLRFLLDGSIPR